MNLIKKRLRVEMWMYEQLHVLYGLEVSGLVNPVRDIVFQKCDLLIVILKENEENTELEIDIDELMDIEEEARRKEWLQVSNRLIQFKSS